MDASRRTFFKAMGLAPALLTRLASADEDGHDTAPSLTARPG